MKSKVYFIPVNQNDASKLIKQKCARLLKETNLFKCIKSGESVVIKIHFGEEGNTGYIKPEYARVFHNEIVNRGARSYISDTNTLYRGRRMTSDNHKAIAYEHGFTPDVVGAEVVIPDDTKKENIAFVPINQHFVKDAKIAKFYKDADVIVDISHFKGHMMTGFGGALKNLGMGCASREGKLEQHSDISPVVIMEKCVGCAACEAVCPVNAVFISQGKSYIKNDACIGCASCIAACKYNAIDVDWESGGNIIQEKMVEYTKAVLEGKKKKAIFINFAL